MKNIKILVVGAIVLFLGWKFIEWINTPIVSKPQKVDISVTDKDWTIGPADAKVTLVEFSDFQCPACGVYHPVVKQILNDYKDRIRFVYRHYPLKDLHPNAMPAARAAEAAGKQGKFWEMGDKLFESQSDWSGLQDPKDKFVEYAKSLGLDVSVFTTDYQSKSFDQKISDSIATGDAILLTQTPTFIVNGVKLINPQGYGDLKKALDEALNN